tara:strand:- start:519 stop:788 length:270 start_codon:yes stop_codon:yes gene_type:complete
MNFEQKLQKLGKAMNKWLADAFSGLNVFSAILVIIFLPGVFVDTPDNFMGFIGYVAYGIVLAIVICGFIALVIDIRNELVKLNENLDKS